ncbi:MAG: two-component system response regulator [Gammaproteobacteria bacterium]
MQNSGPYASVDSTEVPVTHEIGIVVVDDLADNRDLLEALLIGEGFENVHTASDGEQALDILGQYSDIGLVLLDIMMPGIDGYEVCKRIQENEAWREIPVIMVTGGGLTQNQALQKSFAVGATDYISKPINEVELFSRMGMALTLFQERKLRKLQSARLEQSEERFRLTFDMAPVGIAHVDLDGRIIHTNHSMGTLLGYSYDEMTGMELDGFCLHGASELDLASIRDSLKTSDGSVEREARFKTRDGSALWINLRITMLRDASGAPNYLIAILEDITERKQAHQEMERIAFHDPLTGLPNRRLFNKHLTGAIVEGQGRSEPLAVMFLDLDHFKQVNDSLGHAAGDRLLQQASVRIETTINDRGVLARMGGDEFAILMTRDVRVDTAGELAQDIVEAFRLPLEVESRDIIVTPSIGISLYPRDGSTPELLMRNADAAMYRAKESGRNGFRMYNSAMSFKVEERLSLEQSLRRAQEREELHVLYQPQCRIETGEVIGCEVLARWEHPEFGLMDPEKFIPLAEDTGLILAIGEWVMRQACEQIKTWQSRNVKVVPVMVNLSLIQMRTDGVIAMVQRVLRESGVDARHLGIEITENIAALNTEHVIDLLTQLHDHGVQVVMDDFGTGYSSLSRLKRFPLDALKIDKSFIGDITEDPDDEAIVRAIVALAKNLNLMVIAEGIETEAQLKVLADIGCAAAQGFLYGRPMRAERFEEVMASGYLRPESGLGATG